jgi:hypothetical protein
MILRRQGPSTPPLVRRGGEHVASVQVDHVKLLQVYGRTPKVAAETTDVAFGVPSDIEAGRIDVTATEGWKALLVDLDD